MAFRDALHTAQGHEEGERESLVGRWRRCPAQGRTPSGRQMTSGFFFIQKVAGVLLASSSSILPSVVQQGSEKAVQTLLFSSPHLEGPASRGVSPTPGQPLRLHRLDLLHAWEVRTWRDGGRQGEREQQV